MRCDGLYRACEVQQHAGLGGESAFKVGGCCDVFGVVAVGVSELEEIRVVQGCAVDVRSDNVMKGICMRLDKKNRDAATGDNLLLEQC